MMVTAITFAGGTHPGRVRQANEDAYYPTAPNGIDPAALQRNGHLFIVADGVGGNRGGARASEIAVGRVPAFFYAAPNGDPGRALAVAMDSAAREIVAEAAANPERANMRCTFVAAVVKDNSATIAHLGDARAYLWRGGVLQPLTRDHTWVMMQVEKGTLTEAEALNHPDRNVITKSMGDPTYPEPGAVSVALQEGDRLLLCSDGLSGVATDAEIAAVMARAADPAAARKELIDLANRKGGPDNVTAVVVQAGRAAAGGAARVAAAAAGGGGAARGTTAGATAGAATPLLLLGVVVAALLLSAFLIFRPGAGQANVPPPVVETEAGDGPGATGVAIAATVPGAPTSTPAGAAAQDVITSTEGVTATVPVATAVPTTAAAMAALATPTRPAATPTAATSGTLSGVALMEPGDSCNGQYPEHRGDVVFRWSYRGPAPGESFRVQYRTRGAVGWDTAPDTPTRSGNEWLVRVEALSTAPGTYEWQVVNQQGDAAPVMNCFTVPGAAGGGGGDTSPEPGPPDPPLRPTDPPVPIVTATPPPVGPTVTPGPTETPEPTNTPVARPTTGP